MDTNDPRCPRTEQATVQEPTPQLPYGQKAIKKIWVTVMAAGKRKTHCKIAPPRMSFNNQGIEELLTAVVRNCVAKLPRYEFRIVQVGPAAFNVIGDKKPTPDPVDVAVCEMASKIIGAA